MEEMNSHKGRPNVIDVEQLPALVRLMKRQNGDAFTLHGAPVAIFARDGRLCVRYQSGAWYHYDLAAGSWW